MDSTELLFEAEARPEAPDERDIGSDDPCEDFSVSQRLVSRPCKTIIILSVSVLALLGLAPYGEHGSLVPEFVLSLWALRLGFHKLLHKTSEESWITIRHQGYDCWTPCKGAGQCDHFCGQGNACCKKGVLEDPSNYENPPECFNITDFWTDHHECVNPSLEVKNKHFAQDCWPPCEIGGLCSWCGGGNVCCRKGNTDDPPECEGILDWPTEKRHTCVEPVKHVPVMHEGQDCYDRCKGPGFCSWCGSGNACCKYGDTYGPVECRAVVYFPARTHYVCVAPSTKPTPTVAPPRQPASIDTSCPDGKVLGKYGCREADGPQDQTFYIYVVGNSSTSRALTSNVIARNLGGILHYVHNHIIGSCPRKYGIDRIRRFEVTVKNTQSLYTQRSGSQMGPFMDFQAGQCVSEDCNKTWQRYGYVVGCKKQSSSGYKPAWYSFPGECPNTPLAFKSEDCAVDFPGGECDEVTGGRDCTFSSWKDAGEVLIDELEGRNETLGLQEWCGQGNQEYDPDIDAGLGIDFWDKKEDHTFIRERMYKLAYLFWKKFKSFPTRVTEPCDQEEHRRLSSS